MLDCSAMSCCATESHTAVRAKGSHPQEKSEDLLLFLEVRQTRTMPTMQQGCDSYKMASFFAWSVFPIIRYIYIYIQIRDMPSAGSLTSTQARGMAHWLSDIFINWGKVEAWQSNNCLSESMKTKTWLGGCRAGAFCKMNDTYITFCRHLCHWYATFILVLQRRLASFKV